MIGYLPIMFFFIFLKKVLKVKKGQIIIKTERSNIVKVKKEVGAYDVPSM
ncbi:hypothetical protein C289_1465 [Anoxybacillus ayderensis]|nr:hypothetical protein C289_1465 [Anoxybacillus ayderensis]